MNTNKSSPHNGLTILNKMKNNEQTAITPYIKPKEATHFRRNHEGNGAQQQRARNCLANVETFETAFTMW